jgi:hypothetical protein
MNQLIGLYELVYNTQQFLGADSIKLPDKDGRTDRQLYAEDRNPRRYFTFDYVFADTGGGCYGSRHSIQDDEVSNFLVTPDEVLETIRALVTARLQTTTKTANQILSDVGNYRLKK